MAHTDSDIVVEYIEAAKAERDALVFKLNESDQARRKSEQVLASLRAEIAEGDRDLYEVRAVRISYRDEGYSAATATGFARATVTRPLYAVPRESVPFDGAGDLQGRVREDESVIELGYPTRAIYGIFSGSEFESFRLWWSNAAPGKATKGAK
jgi:hypothetical protein